MKPTCLARGPISQRHGQVINFEKCSFIDRIITNQSYSPMEDKIHYSLVEANVMSSRALH